MATSQYAYQIASGLATKHLTDAEYIKGGFFVVEEYSTLIEKDDDDRYLNYIPVTQDSDGTIVPGSLCYCQDIAKFYKFMEPDPAHTYGYWREAALDPGRSSTGLDWDLYNPSGRWTEACLVSYGVCQDADVVIPKEFGGFTVTQINADAFNGCYSLTSVTIPDSVTSIGEYAFANCPNLRSVRIPASVKSIDQSAFDACPNLTIYCEAAEEPSGWNATWAPEGTRVIWGSVFSFERLSERLADLQGISGQEVYI